MFEVSNNQLVAQFNFNDFSQAFAFVARVSLLAEQHNHHPKLVWEYNRVAISLCTHDAGNTITEKDYKLAEAIEKL